MTTLAVMMALGLAAPPAANPTPPLPPQEVVVETEHGTFVVRLREDLAPNHVRHVVKVARSGGYDGTTFHRIIPRGIIQGGDPLSKDPAKSSRYGTGGLGLLKAELSDQPMTRGKVAAVQRPSNVDSAGNQFFVCLSDQPSLTGKYTIFGEVVEGMDVVDKIGETPVEGQKALARVAMRKVTVRPAASPAPPSPGP